MNVRLPAVSVAVGTTDTIATLHVEGFLEAGFSFKNNTANALDALEVHAKFSKDGPIVPLATQASDYSSPLWPIRRGDALMSLAGNTTGRLFLNVAGIHTLIIKASASGTITNIDIDGQLT